MNRLITLLVIIIASMLSSGCAGIIQTRTNGYLAANEQALPKSGPYYVAGNPKAKNPILDDEIGNKLRQELQQKGFTIGDKESSKFVIAYTYSISAGTATDIAPVYTPGSTSSVTTQGPGGFYTGTVTTPGSTQYVPITVDQYTRQMTVYVIPIDFSVEKPKPIWIGEVVSRGSMDDLRQISNYLIKAVVEKFGQNTPGTVKQNWSYSK